MAAVGVDRADALLALVNLLSGRVTTRPYDVETGGCTTRPYDVETGGFTTRPYDVETGGCTTRLYEYTSLPHAPSIQSRHRAFG